MVKKTITLSGGTTMRVSLRHEPLSDRNMIYISVILRSSEGWKSGDITLDVKDNEGRPIRILNAHSADDPLPWVGERITNYHQYIQTFNLDAPASVVPRKAEIRLRSEQGVVEFSE